MKRTVYCLIAGALWGCFGYLLGRRALGAAIWGGVLAAPVIGLLVGGLVQGLFERQQGVRRGLVALASLYLSATLFGLAIGLGTWSGLTPGYRSANTLIESVGVVWWGTTLTGFILFLWPLAYGTHWLIGWATEQ